MANPTALQQVLGGRFRLDALLGEGGMGAVYVATDLSIGRKVAVKLLRRELADDPQSLERMREEAVSLASLRHPNVVQLYDFHAASPDATFLLMELVEGETLAQRLAKVGPLPLPVAVDYVRQVLSALSAAHARGIIHRDIKPSNVLVVAVPMQKDLIKVLDFGIAKLTEETIRRRPTTAGVLLGTPSAMSPEQARGGVVDARSDVYACGLLLYTLLAGKNPFSGGPDLATTLERVLHVLPPPLVEVRPDVPRALSDVIAKAIAKDPSLRWASALDLASAVDRALVEATPTAAHARLSAAPGPAMVAPAFVPQVDSGAQHPPRPPSPGLSPGVIVALTAMGTLLLVSVGAVGYLMWARASGPVAAAPSASSLVLPSTIATPSTASASASVTAAASASARPPSTPSKTSKTDTVTGPQATGRASGKSCRCFLTRDAAAVHHMGTNQPLAQNPVLPSCICRAHDGANLCFKEIKPCADCNRSFDAVCAKADEKRPGRPDAPCEGWSSIGQKASGKLECQYETSVTFVASGKDDAPCTGFTHEGKRAEGVTRCD